MLNLIKNYKFWRCANAFLLIICIWIYGTATSILFDWVTSVPKKKVIFKTTKYYIFKLQNLNTKEIWYFLLFYYTKDKVYWSNLFSQKILFQIYLQVQAKGRITNFPKKLEIFINVSHFSISNILSLFLSLQNCTLANKT